MPSLRHRPLNVALDFTRKFAWNGTLQRALPPLAAGSATEVALGAVPLCRGEFEISASVEETRLWSPPAAANKDSNDNDDVAAGTVPPPTRRERSETEIMMDAVLGAKERRIWHSRRPCFVSVRDRT